MQSAEVYLAIPNGVYTHQACNRHYFRVSEVRLVKTNRSPWNSLLIYCGITQLFVGISCFQLLIRIYNDAYAALVEYNKNPYDLGEAITVRELYEKWSELYFKTLKTYGSVRIMMTAWNYCSAVYDMRVMDIRARHIKGCMEEGTAIVRGREQHPNAVMKNKIKTLFNLMLDYALEYELVDRNYSRTFNLPDEVVKEAQAVRKEHIPFDEDEMERLWEHTDDTLFVDMILIQCYSGWRPQELCQLELEHVDLENWTFQGGMKTEAGIDRVVPIHTRIRPLVERKYKESVSAGSKYLFNYVDRRSGKLSMVNYKYYQHVFAKARDTLGLNPNHRPHDGRKHFVTAAKKSGADEYAIKYLVGHKISDITEKIYTQRDFEWLRDEIEKIR